MDSPQYNVSVDGSVLEGFDTDSVLLQLQQQLKLPEAKARLLIAGKTVTVKRGVDAAVANAYCRKLQALGVGAHLEPASARAANAGNATTDPNAAATAAAPQLKARYFAEAPLAIADSSVSSAFKRAVRKATIVLGGILLAYGALAMASVWLFFYYAVHYVGFLKVPPLLFSATIYLTVSLLLALLALLIWRPLLPQPRKADAGVLLSPLQEPELFVFVAQLCEKLALPAPTQIAATTATAHSISLLPGCKNLARGEYRLTLSLPALENGSLAQVSAILAADLATQARLPILRYRLLAQRTHHRLDNCLAGRDWLAQHLDKLADSAPAKLSRILDFATKIVALANRYLQKLSAHLTGIEAKLQRPLLQERDRYTALIGGSGHFVESMMVCARLEAATRDANAKNLEDRIDGGLVDDLPALIRHYCEGLEEDFARSMRRKWDAETTPRSDEPPIMRERIELVAAAAKPGSIADARPASSLLQRRDELARTITLNSYRTANLCFDPARLMPVDELTYAATQDILQRQQAAIYFNDWLRPFRFWILADYKLIADMPLQDAAAQLSVCVNEIRRLSPDRAKLLAEYERLHNQLREILLAQHVLAAGKKFAFRYFHYDGTTLAPILEERQQEIGAVMDKLAQQETVMGGRITLGLRLCGQAERDVRELHDSMRLLHDTGARLYKLAFDCFQLEQLLRRQHQLREADYTMPIKRLETKIDDACNVLMARLQDIPYPLDSRHRALSDFVAAALSPPDAAQRSPILQRAQRIIDLLYRFNEKLSRQAADYGTIAEEAYRIEPIRLIGGK